MIDYKNFTEQDVTDYLRKFDLSPIETDNFGLFGKVGQTIELESTTNEDYIIFEITGGIYGIKICQDVDMSINEVWSEDVPEMQKLVKAVTSWLQDYIDDEVQEYHDGIREAEGYPENDRNFNIR